jgi:uncharacterized protein DUF6220
MAATFEPRGHSLARPHASGATGFGLAGVPTIPAPSRASANPAAAVPAIARRRAERRGVARAHLIVARLVFGGVIVQVFLAGLGLFGGMGFLPHAIFAPLLVLASFSLPILAHVGRITRALIGLSWLLTGLMIAQGLLIDAGRYLWYPVASLHPVNALALALVAYSLARARDAER